MILSKPLVRLRHLPAVFMKYTLVVDVMRLCGRRMNSLLTARFLFSALVLAAVNDYQLRLANTSVLTPMIMVVTITATAQSPASRSSVWSFLLVYI